MAILIDTSVLLAYVYSKDINHARASRFMRTLANEKRIISAPVLNELFHMTATRIHYAQATKVFADTQVNFQIEALTTADMRRMEEIMLKYADSRFDFADAAIMAQAERLNITRIATFDRRDFPIFRPTHCETLELLP